MLWTLGKAGLKTIDLTIVIWFSKCLDGNVY